MADVGATLCPLCSQAGGRIVFDTHDLRVIHAQEAGLEAFYRIVWNAHQAEWTDLTESEQLRCMRAISAVERAMRDVLAPTKINIASLGNMVPHLHWHVIARFDWDGFFPAPVWSAAHTPADQLPSQQVAELIAKREALEQVMQVNLTEGLRSRF